MRPKPLRSFAIATRIKPAPTGVDLMLKIGTALLMTFAATSVADCVLIRSLVQKHVGAAGAAIAAGRLVSRH